MGLDELVIWTTHWYCGICAEVYNDWNTCARIVGNGPVFVVISMVWAHGFAYSMRRADGVKGRLKLSMKNPVWVLLDPLNKTRPPAGQGVHQYPTAAYDDQLPHLTGSMWPSLAGRKTARPLCRRRRDETDRGEVGGARRALFSPMISWATA
jgi:hypothetical protein